MRRRTSRSLVVLGVILAQVTGGGGDGLTAEYLDQSSRLEPDGRFAAILDLDLHVVDSATGETQRQDAL